MCLKITSRRARQHDWSVFLIISTGAFKWTTSSSANDDQNEELKILPRSLYVIEFSDQMFHVSLLLQMVDPTKNISDGLFDKISSFLLENHIRWHPFCKLHILKLLVSCWVHSTVHIAVLDLDMSSLWSRTLWHTFWMIALHILGAIVFSLVVTHWHCLR